MRIDRTLLAGLLLLSQNAALSAQTPALTDPSKTMAAQPRIQVQEVAQPERLPPTEGMSPTIVPTAYRTPGRSLAPTSVPYEGVLPGASGYQSMMESSGWCEETCDAPPIGAWFGSAEALVMTRSTQGDQFWSTSDTTSGALLMNSDQAAVGWAGGYEIQIGRRTCCGSAWEVTYWNLESLEGDQQVRSFANPGQLSTPLDVGLVTFNGVDASNYFNGAHLHRIERYDSAQNLELNFWQAPVPVRDGRLSVNCLAGVRWMQFNDQLIFGSVSGGGGGGLVPAAANFGDNGGASEAYLNVDTRNNLVGFQLGSHADFSWRSGWSLFCTPRVGIYANFMDQSTRVYTGDGFNGLASPPGLTPTFYPIEVTKTDVACLTQIDAGAKCRFAPHWQATIAYRIVGVAGVALADSQIPTALANFGAFQNIESGGGLVLQGLTLGLEFNY